MGNTSPLGVTTVKNKKTTTMRMDLLQDKCKACKK
jgi:hypothetical protein